MPREEPRQCRRTLQRLAAGHLENRGHGMKSPRLYLFDPNLKGSGGHYLGYAMRIARSSEALGITTVSVANTLATPDLAGSRVVPGLEWDYWQEMCPTAGEDPHDH